MMRPESEIAERIEQYRRLFRGLSGDAARREVGAAILLLNWVLGNPPFDIDVGSSVLRDDLDKISGAVTEPTE